jgi:hypothetical protein
MEEILKELHQAKQKWPRYYSDVIHAAAIIGEEAGEILKAALDYTYDNGAIEDVEKETIQTAAMCIRLLENIDKLKAYPKHIKEYNGVL